MSREPASIAFIHSGAPDAGEAAERLAALYGQTDPAQADIIVALGGDGFMLQTLHRFMNTGKRIYGMNRGSVGFLMNDYNDIDLTGRIDAAVENIVRPLEMRTIAADGSESMALAINEVSLFRQSYQAAKLKISIDGKVRLEELVCDGIMVATPPVRLGTLTPMMAFCTASGSVVPAFSTALAHMLKPI